MACSMCGIRSESPSLVFTDLRRSVRSLNVVRMAAACPRLSLVAFHMALPVIASFSGLRPMPTVWLWGGPAETHWWMVAVGVAAGGRNAGWVGAPMGAATGAGAA
eukprot:11288100-Alexandrium_andersonii.AAC.2